MGESRNSDGRFSSEHTDEEILAATRAHEPAATSEVADEVGMTRQGADRRLRQLRDDGRVSSKKIGASLVWFAPEQGRQEPADTARAGDVAAATDGPADPPADAHAAEIGGSSGTVIDLGKLSFKRDITRARRSHLEEWLQYAADTDGVQKSDFEEWWNSDRTGETGYNAGSFWEAFAKAAMKQSDQFAKPNARTYRYTGAGLEGS